MCLTSELLIHLAPVDKNFSCLRYLIEPRSSSRITLHRPSNKSLLVQPYIDLPTSLFLKYLTDLFIILLLFCGIVFHLIYVDFHIISLLLNLLHIILVHLIYLYLTLRNSRHTKLFNHLFLLHVPLSYLHLSY